LNMNPPADVGRKLRRNDNYVKNMTSQISAANGFLVAADRFE